MTVRSPRLSIGWWGKVVHVRAIGVNLSIEGKDGRRRHLGSRMPIGLVTDLAVEDSGIPVGIEVQMMCGKGTFFVSVRTHGCKEDR
jgi:hypothetical protein